MESVLDMDWYYSKLSRLRDGGRLAGAEAKNEIMSLWIWDIRSRAIVGRVNVRWDDFNLIPGVLPFLDSKLRWVNAIQASLNDCLKGGRSWLVFPICRSCTDEMCRGPPDEPSEASIPSYAVIVSALVLLCLVYQYLTGTVDLGSSKAYSRSSLDFRDIYVAIVLFLGAYVWIKFREVALGSKGVHQINRKDKRGRITKVVYQPRFKPPKENGTVFHWMYLGQYATPEEASILYQIAAFYYNDGQGGSLDLEDGRRFSIPPMSEGQRSLTGAEKRAWVKVQAKKVYEEFRKEKAEAALIHDLLEACEDQATPSQGVDPCEASLSDSDEHQLPLLAENLGLAIVMLDDPGLEGTSQPIGGMHEGFVTTIGHSLGFQEESAIPNPQLTPDTQSGMGINYSNQLNLPQIMQNQQQQLQELSAQISVLQNQQLILQQQLEESRIRISQLEDQHSLQQQLQVINNQGIPSFEVEMEQTACLNKITPAGLMALPFGDAEAQETFI